MADNRKRLGEFGEKVAKLHLEDNGYRVLETNFRCPVGEIDIVARKEDYLVFVEVRTRRGRGFGTPEESITPAKKAKLIELAYFYIQTHQLSSPLWRIDVVAVELDVQGRTTRIEIIANAIELLDHC